MSQKTQEIFDSMKKARRLLEMANFARRLAKIIKSYNASPANNVGWSEMLKFYGIKPRAVTISETKLAEEIARKLAILSVQNLHLILYHPIAEEIFSQLAMSFRKNIVFNAYLDSKVLMYVNARIEYNIKVYDVEPSTNMPKQRSIYNIKLLKEFLAGGKYFLCCDSAKELENAPTDEILKATMKEKKFARLGNFEIYSKDQKDNILPQMCLGKICLPYYV